MIPTTRSSLYLKAVSVTAVLVGLGSLLGFVRDLLLARIFGASSASDAFLVAWTVPETAAPLLIEGAMAFVLVPLFSRALEQGRDVRKVVAETLPVISAVLMAIGAATAVAAPWMVETLAPGIAAPDLAIDCTRLTSVTVLMFGLAGYLSAALRAHQAFAAPATIYVAYNLGIIVFVLALHDAFGALAAALGVMAGGVAMVAAQLPAFVRHVGLPRLNSFGALIPLAAFAPIAAFSLIRQGQIFVERFLGSSLAVGSISQMNYAQKIAQVPMVLSLIVATVTFPQLVRSVTAKNTAAARHRITGDLTIAALIVLPATGILIVFAPEIVHILLEQGAFTPADTQATAQFMRIYSLGLLGQTIVGVACRAYFCTARPAWFPGVAMAGGLLTTLSLATTTVPYWGAPGIAAANAVGITATALLLLYGLRGLDLALSLRALAPTAGLLILPTVAAVTTGVLVRTFLRDFPAVTVLVPGVVLMALVFCASSVITRPKEIIRMLQAEQTEERT